MGVYQTILSNVRQAQDLFFSFDMDHFISIATVLGVFILGILTGLKVFAKFLTWLLNRHPQQIMAVLIGLMIGAIHKVWPWQNEILSNTSAKIEKTVAVLPSQFQGDSPQTIKAIIIMVFGFGILFLMERSKNRIKNEG